MIRLYVDEQGTDTLKNLDKDNLRFLSLTGVAMDITHVHSYLVPEMNKLKGELFNEDPDSPIILHRKEILGGKGPFEQIRTNPDFREKFDTRLLEIIRGADYKVITALIDKSWMIQQNHWTRKHPYHYLLEVLVEKFSQYLIYRGRDIGDIMPESRQSKLDNLLQSEYDRLRKEGSKYVKSDVIKAVLKGSKLKFRKKSDNIAGLQICDLIAHPSHIFTRDKMDHNVNQGEFCKKMIKVLTDEKYDRSNSGVIKGYGYKHLP